MGKFVVGIEIGLEWSIEEFGGLVLRVGELVLVRMGFLFLVLFWVFLFFMVWIDI